MQNTKLIEALEVLSLSFENLNENAVNVAYRAHVQIAHPDKGGSAEAMQRLNDAKTLLLKHIQRNQKPVFLHANERSDCPQCNGKGFVWVRNGFSQLRKICVACKISAEKEEE